VTEAYIVFSSVATPSVLSPFEGLAFEAKGPGKRTLLGEAWRADITDQLRQDPVVSANLATEWSVSACACAAWLERQRTAAGLSAAGQFVGSPTQERTLRTSD
jgi:hypothetical protein